MITSKKLTAERIAEIEKFPIIYDEASPKFSKEELQEFVPYHKEYFDMSTCFFSDVRYYVHNRRLI